MITKALRLYGKEDLRLEAFELPPITADELLVKIVSDSLCMSSYKAAIQGAEHKRVPKDVAVNPIILGHEFCGEILEVGANLTGKYKEGERFTIQPAMEGTFRAAGYSFPYLGGDTQYAIVPKEYIEHEGILVYEGDAWFYGSLAEPLSCVIGAAHANYHTKYGTYQHDMGIRPGGNMALLAAAGPMGLVMIDNILHGDGPKPGLLVVTDIDAARLARAVQILSLEDAKQQGVRLVYLNTGDTKDPVAALKELAGGEYDDVFVFAPVATLIEQADAMLAQDGCLNFFAGPSEPDFSAKFNFYNVHYGSTHVTGTSGGNTSDIREALTLSASGRVDPTILVTHVGGLDAARETTLNLPHIPGGKKLLYTHISMPLVALSELEVLGEKDPMYAELAAICGRNGGLWNIEAERYLLAHAKPI